VEEEQRNRADSSLNGEEVVEKEQSWLWAIQWISKVFLISGFMRLKEFIKRPSNSSVNGKVDLLNSNCTT